MHFLGIDTSTTSGKALLTGECGELLQWHHRRIRFSFGEAGLKGEAIFAVGVTGQMHGLVQLAAEGNALRPGIQWNTRVPRSIKNSTWMIRSEIVSAVKKSQAKICCLECLGTILAGTTELQDSRIRALQSEALNPPIYCLLKTIRLAKRLAV